MSARPSKSDAIWAVVPLKDLSGGKQRLKPALSRNQRAGLIRAMAEDVLEALTASSAIDHVVILSNDEAVKELADAYGASLLRDDEATGLSGAVEKAAQHLKQLGIATMVSVHGDLPLASSADFDDVLGTRRPAPSLTIVPSHDADGSNVMVSSPPDVVAFHYGKASLLAHLDAAGAAGIEVEICPNQNLGLDVDTPSDLKMLIRHLQATKAPSKTKLFLTKSGIAGGLTGN